MFPKYCLIQTEKFSVLYQPTQLDLKYTVTYMAIRCALTFPVMFYEIKLKFKYTQFFFPEKNCIFSFMNLSICFDFARVKAAKVEKEHSKTESSFFIFFFFLLLCHFWSYFIILFFILKKKWQKIFTNFVLESGSHRVLKSEVQFHCIQIQTSMQVCFQSTILTRTWIVSPEQTAC